MRYLEARGGVVAYLFFPELFSDGGEPEWRGQRPFTREKGVLRQVSSSGAGGGEESNESQRFLVCVEVCLLS